MAWDFGLDSSLPKKFQGKSLGADSLIKKAPKNQDAPFFLVLLDKDYSKGQIEIIKRFLTRNLGENFALVQSTKVPLSDEDIKTKTTETFYQLRFPFETVFSGGEYVILASGGALYSLSKDDLQISYFYDTITNVKSYVYCPLVKRYVFPIPSFFDIFDFNNSLKMVPNTYVFRFFLAQIQKAKGFLNRSWCLPYQEESFPQPQVHLIKTKKEFVDVLDSLSEDQMVTWDLETSGFHFLKDIIGYITFSCDGIVGYCAPWRVVDKEKLNSWFATKKQIGANLKFDVKFLWKEGILNARIDGDVVQLGHVLNETRNNSLKTNAWIYSNLGGYEFDLDNYVKQVKIKSYLDIPEKILVKYATYDAIATYRVFVNQIRHLQWVDSEFPNHKEFGKSLTWYYQDLMIPSLNVFADMEYQGLYISKERLDQAQKDIESSIQNLTKELAEKLGVDETFDFNSLQRLGKLLKSKGWKNYGESKTGFLLTGDVQLQKWINDGHVEAKIIMELRSLKTILQTFIGTNDNEGWRKHLVYHPEDNSYRVHANYAHMLADTGRSKCRDPNLQQIPREGIVPKIVDTPNNDEYVILSLDYSSLQVRLAGIDGRDETIAQIYGGDGVAKDFHSNTAWPIFAKNKLFVTLELEDGTTKYFSENSPVSVIRDGKKITIPAKDILTSDILEDEDF